MIKFLHPYHLVTERPWPLIGSLTLIILIIGFIKWFFEFNNNLLFLGNILILLILIQWWRDIIRERTFQGNHTKIVLKSIKLGIILFILSEIIFFFSFFWCYFHIYLSPRVEIGNLWPSKRILIFNPYNIPLLNTLILLSSGIRITWCHYSILKNNYINRINSIKLTLFLGTIFIIFQYKEYNESYFTISDSIYGSIFFLLTGFHGLHVIIGTIFILVIFIRLKNFHFSKIHHLGFEISSWYWHFVDLVWLFLYLFIYWIAY